MSKKLKPFLAHSELTDCIYIIDGNDKYEVTEQCIKAMKATNRLPRWIPITSRPMTEEEKEHYKIHPDYRDECRIFNCKLPDDGQEVLISVYGGVEVDTFVKDGNDGCYFEGRDIDDVDAWMPLSEPYKTESEVK